MARRSATRLFGLLLPSPPLRLIDQAGQSALGTKCRLDFYPLLLIADHDGPGSGGLGLAWEKTRARVVAGASAATPPSSPLIAPSAYYDAALRHMPHGLCMFDEAARLLLCNPAYAKLYSLPGNLTVPGTPLDAILGYRQSVGNAPRKMDTYFDVVHEALKQERYAWVRVPLQDGRTIHITHNPIAEGGYVAVHEDVTAHVRAEEQIRHLAEHDSLTGLLNRASFQGTIERTLAGTRPDEVLAVHYMDLDRFKAVNDTLGHPAGDLLLQMVADRISLCLRETDVVARLGGDEFAILQVALKSPREAGRLAARLVERIADPFDIQGTAVAIGASVGTSLFPRHGSSAENLVKLADAALYKAKSAGRSTFRLHSAGSQA